MPKPHVSAAALASLTELVPPRLTKRLDANPRAAEAWIAEDAADGWIVATDGDDRVTLRGEIIASLDQITCSCLLSPRCFHALAVLSLLPLATHPAAATPAQEAPAAVESAAAPALEPSQQQAAERALGVVERVIGGGLANVSTARLGELLRAVHEARRHGLPRLEGALLAVVDDVRRLRERDPDFVLGDAADGLATLWTTSSLLARGEARHQELSLVGTARRSYQERRGLRLTGLGTEPIVASGYAGVVSRLTDGREVFSAVELWPGEDDRAVAASAAQLRFGEISIAHRDVLETTLLFAVARVSSDGRLGAGQDVSAARAPLDEAPRERFLDRGRADDQLAYHPLLAGADDAVHVFAGQFVDRGGPALALSSGAIVPVDPAIDHPRFAFRENLALLARSGASARVVCKARSRGAELRLVPLTVFPAPALARSITSAFDLGFTRRARADLPTGDQPPRDAPGETGPDALAPLRARVHRWALGGAGTLPTAALPLVAIEAERLRGSLLPTLGNAVTRLATAASEPAERASEAWTAALCALRAAERTMARTALGIEPASSPTG